MMRVVVLCCLVIALSITLSMSASAVPSGPFTVFLTSVTSQINNLNFTVSGLFSSCPLSLYTVKSYSLTNLTVFDSSNNQIGWYKDPGANQNIAINLAPGASATLSWFGTFQSPVDTSKASKISVEYYLVGTQSSNPNYSQTASLFVQPSDCAVPEASSIALGFSGLTGVFGYVMRRRKLS